MNDDRRQALLAARTVNAVDFVEVDPASETTLVVHFLFALPGSPPAEQPVPAPGTPPGPADFQVTGGERITSISVTAAVPRPGTFDQLNAESLSSLFAEVGRIFLADAANPVRYMQGE